MDKPATTKQDTRHIGHAHCVAVAQLGVGRRPALRRFISIITYSGKVFVCALSLVGGTMVGALFSGALGLKGPRMPPALDLRLLGLLILIGGLALAIGLAEIGRRLRGGFSSRWLSLAWFTYACMGIANTIEAASFTTIGGSPWMAVSWVPASLLVSGMVALLFRNTTVDADPCVSIRAFFTGRTPQQWMVRLLGAWLAFPIVYFAFGMPVGLVVGNAYRDQVFGLRLPGIGVIMAVQLVRGLFVLLASLPMIIAWSDSRRRFWITYGLGLFVFLGFYGLIQAYWLPWGMRGLHTLEILLDSLVYAWLLATLLLTRERPSLNGSRVRRHDTAERELGSLA